MTTRTTVSVSQAGTVMAILELFQKADADEQRTESLKRILHKYADEVAASSVAANSLTSPRDDYEEGDSFAGMGEPAVAQQAADHAGGQQPVARVESWTNGSHWRNYKLEWLQDVPAGTLLFAGAAPAAPAPLTAEQHFKLSDHEIEHLRTNPHALDLLMDYHDARQAEADAFFDGADIGTTGNKLRRQALYERGRSLMAEDLDVWPDHLRLAFGFPTRAPAVSPAAKPLAGWTFSRGEDGRIVVGSPVYGPGVLATWAARSGGNLAERVLHALADALLDAGIAGDLINGAAGAAANKDTP